MESISSLMWRTPSGTALAAHVGDLWMRLERPELSNGSVYWLESRAPDGTRVLLRRTVAGRVDVVSPPGVDVRNGVHEYGGGSYAVRDGTIVLSSGADGRLVRVDPGGGSDPLTPVPPAPDAVRYGEGITFADDDVVCVSEARRGRRDQPACPRAALGAERSCSPPAATSTPLRARAVTAGCSRGRRGTTRGCPSSAATSGARARRGPFAHRRQARRGRSVRIGLPTAVRP